MSSDEPGLTPEPSLLLSQSIDIDILVNPDVTHSVTHCIPHECSVKGNGLCQVNQDGALKDALKS